MQESLSYGFPLFLVGILFYYISFSFPVYFLSSMRSSMRIKPNVTVYLDTRRELDSGASPLTIRVTFIKFIGAKKVWDQRYFPTGLHFTKEEYKKINSSKRNDAHLQLQKKIKKIELKAIDIVDTNPYLTPELFRVLFTGEYRVAGDLTQLFREKISMLYNGGQLASASLYESTLKSLTEFTTSLNLHLIDEAWLKRYEHWMRTEGWRKKKEGDKGNSITTIGLYHGLRAPFHVQRLLLVKIPCIPYRHGQVNTRHTPCTPPTAPLPPQYQWRQLRTLTMVHLRKYVFPPNNYKTRPVLPLKQLLICQDFLYLVDTYLSPNQKHVAFEHLFW